MRDRGLGRGRHRRRQRGGEDEPRGKAADEIAERPRARDIAAHAAIGLAQRALDQGDPVGQAAGLGDAAAARTVKPHGVHLVEIGHGAVAFRHLDDLGHRADVAIHRVDGFEGDDLGRVGGQRRQLAVQVLGVVVFPDHLAGAGMADALDHAGVVGRVREDDRIRQTAAQGRKRGPVRDIARGEEQRRLLAVQVSEFRLQRDVMRIGAGYVARATRPGAALVHHLLHPRTHVRMLAHPEVVVRTPDSEILRTPHGPAPGLGEGLAVPLQLGEDAVVALCLEVVQLGSEQRVEIHRSSPVSIFGARPDCPGTGKCPCSLGARGSMAQSGFPEVNEGPRCFGVQRPRPCRYK
ncbi:hypothetical protein OA50_03059 [Mameliella alba]|uniref:Uncharacterized protein n=1 Tax=Mameliella alba TaxID=561184 RepID=A0A0B3SQ88_9RHOB|nr:hypothetical protein OA50_03059 [Mameliella alba]